MKKELQPKVVKQGNANLAIESQFVVMKFGGTSISSASNWKTILGLIGKNIDLGYKPNDVVSALAGISNLLDSLTKDISVSNLDRCIGNFYDTHKKLADDLKVSMSSIKSEFDYLTQLVDSIKITGDINSKIVKDADFKFYITASLKCRTKRRAIELRKLGKKVKFA